jgi:hypothetical protein
MSLRVIWQYMDRSVTKKILYGPQKLRSIYFFGDGPVHILPYDPQCHELFAIYWPVNILVYHINTGQISVFALICPYLPPYSTSGISAVVSKIYTLLSKYKERWCIRSYFNKINTFQHIGIKSNLKRNNRFE